MADRAIRVSLSAQVNEYVQGMRRAAKATHDVDDAASKLPQYRAALEETGRAGMIMGGLIAAGLGVAVARSAEFDSAMSAVQAATHETAENMDLLRQAALDAGASTVFSATESANAIEELAKAGVSTADILGGGLTGALDLAAAGGLGVADAAGIAATSLKMFNLEGDDMAHVADLLAAGAGKAMGDVSDLSQALNQSGLVAKQTGLSIEETTAGLAAFAEQGLLGSDAGTSFKAMLQRLTPQSGEAAQLMEELGISAYDAQGNFIGLAKFAGNLQGALQGLTPQQRNSAMATIFGSDAVRAASVIYSQGEQGIRDWTEAVDDQGYAAETARIRLDNLKGDLEALGGAMETALINTGSAANDTLRTMAQALTGLVDMYNGLPKPMQQATLAIGGATAAIALGVGVASKAIPAWQNLKGVVEAAGWTMKGAALTAGAASLALGGVFFIVGELAAAHQRAQAKAQAYADTLADGTQRITDATRDVIATNLTAEKSFLWISQGSLADSAEKLGLSLGTVTDAVSGNADALGKVNAAIEKGISEGYKPMKDANLEAYDAAVMLRQGVEGEIGSLTEAEKIARQKADATDKGTSSSRTAAEAYMAEAESVEDLNKQLTDLIDRINAANGIAQDAVTANARYQSALAGLSSQVERNGTSLDQNTASGSANAAALVDVASAAQKAAEAQFDQDLATMSADEAATKYAGTLAEQRQAFIDSAVSAGFNADQVKALADEIFQMPTKKEFEALVETATAQAKLDDWVRLNDGRVIRVKVAADGGSFTYGGREVTPNANGGLYVGGVKAFANSGFEPGIYPYTAGGIHKFAEQAPEAYISLDPARKQRSEAVWVETGIRGGFGSSGATTTSASEGKPVKVVLESKGGIDLLQYIDARVEQSEQQFIWDLRSI